MTTQAQSNHLKMLAHGFRRNYEWQILASIDTVVAGVRKLWQMWLVVAEYAFPVVFIYTFNFV